MEPASLLKWKRVLLGCRRSENPSQLLRILFLDLIQASFHAGILKVLMTTQTERENARYRKDVEKAGQLKPNGSKASEKA